MQVCLLERRHDLLQLRVQKNRKTPGKSRVRRSQTQEQVPFMKPALQRTRKTPAPVVHGFSAQKVSCS
jgi:hypothetical protein